MQELALFGLVALIGFIIWYLLNDYKEKEREEMERRFWADDKQAEVDDPRDKLSKGGRNEKSKR